MIVGILIGIMVWQLVIFAVCIITNQDDEKMGIVGMLVPWLLLAGFGKIYRPIILAYYRKNYSLCSLYKHMEKEEHGYFGGIGIKNKDIPKYYQKGENEYYINVYKDGKDFKSVPWETMTKIRKNGWFCQEWVDENFLKKG